MIFALTLVPIILMAGSAIDYTRGLAIADILQSAVDAGALAGVVQSAGTRDALATSFFNANASLNAAATLVSVVPKTNADGSYTLTATATVPTSFMQVAGISSITVSRTATAVAPSVPMCVLALNSSAQKALAFSGSAPLVGPSCKVQVNSSNSDAVDLSGSASIRSKDNCFVGSAKTSGGASITPAPDASCPVQSDPFAAYTKPFVGGCTYNGFSSSASTLTINPGVYCNGMNFSNTQVTMNPGAYIINGGKVQTSGSAALNGTGVAFYLANSATVQMSGSSRSTLTAPTSGTLAGFIWFGDGSGNNLQSQLSGSSGSYFDGIVYFPKQQIQLSGSSANATQAPYTAYIADTIQLSGSATISIGSNTSTFAASVPASITTLGTQVTEVHLTK